MFFTDPDDYFRADRASEDLFNFIKEANSEISAIYIRGENKRCFYSSGARSTRFQQALDQIWPDGVYQGSSFYYIPEDESGSAEVMFIYPFFNVRTGEYDRSQRAVCVMLCDITHILNWIANDELEGSAIAAVYGERVVASNRPLTGAENQLMSSLPPGRGRITIDQNGYLSSLFDLPQLGWQLCYTVPEQQLLDGIEQMRVLGLVVLVVLALCLSLVMGQIVSALARPIRQITSDIQSVREGTERRVRSVPLAEMQVLTVGINDMLDSISAAHEENKQAEHRVYMALIEQNRARLYAYRSQINPQFLFNTIL